MSTTTISMKDYQKLQVTMYNAAHGTKYKIFSKLPKEAQESINAAYEKHLKKDEEPVAPTPEEPVTTPTDAPTTDDNTPTNTDAPEQEKPEKQEKEPKVNKKDELLAKVKVFADTLAGEFSQTKEKFYIYKQEKATIKFQLGGGICRIRANGKAGEILQEVEIGVKEHPNWNIKYEVLTEDYEQVLQAIHDYYDPDNQITEEPEDAPETEGEEA